MGGLLRPDGTDYSYDPVEREQELIDDGQVPRLHRHAFICLCGWGLSLVALGLGALGVFLL